MLKTIAQLNEWAEEENITEVGLTVVVSKLYGYLRLMSAKSY